MRSAARALEARPAEDGDFAAEAPAFDPDFAPEARDFAAELFGLAAEARDFAAEVFGLAPEAPDLAAEARDFAAEPRGLAPPALDFPAEAPDLAAEARDFAAEALGFAAAARGFALEAFDLPAALDAGFPPLPAGFARDEDAEARPDFDREEPPAEDAEARGDFARDDPLVPADLVRADGFAARGLSSAEPATSSPAERLLSGALPSRLLERLTGRDRGRLEKTSRLESSAIG